MLLRKKGWQTAESVRTWASNAKGTRNVRSPVCWFDGARLDPTLQSKVRLQPKIQRTEDYWFQRGAKPPAPRSHGAPRVHVHVQFKWSGCPKVHPWWLAVDPIPHNCSVHQNEGIVFPWSCVTDRWKRVQEWPWTGGTSFWSLLQDTFGPRAKELADASAPSNPSTETSVPVVFEKTLVSVPATLAHMQVDEQPASTTHRGPI